MKRLFWERLAWLWILCIPLAVAGGIGYGGQAYNPQSVAITGGSINNVPIGQTTPRNGAFITLGASSTVSGKGFSDYLASPPTIGGTASGVGNFSTMNTPNAVITGGTIGGTSVAGVAAAGAASPYNPASVAITGGTIGGTSVAGVAAAGAASPYNPASVAITGGTIGGITSFASQSPTVNDLGSPTAWSSSYNLFGPNANTTTQSALGLGYDNTNQVSYILSLTPGTAWDALTLDGTIINFYTSGLPAASVSPTGFNSVKGYSLNGNILFSIAAPTISSGFGTSPSITFNNGTAAFYVDVGSGGTASTGTINMNVIATHYWSCAVTYDNDDVVTGKETIYSQISNQIVGFTNITRSTGVATPWTANDVFFVNCITM